MKNSDGAPENGGTPREKANRYQPKSNLFATQLYKKHTLKEIVRVRKMLDIALAYAVGETKQQLNTMIYGTITIVLC